MIHIIKLAVGARDPKHIEQLQRARAKARGVTKTRRAYTRRKPVREDAGDGSLYWVIQGLIRCRQKILGFESELDQEGQPYCLFVLDPKIVLVQPTPRRPFQGLRYLDPADAPVDLPPGAKGEAPPEAMLAELKELGLL